MSEAPERAGQFNIGGKWYVSADIHEAVVAKYQSLVSWADTQAGTPCEQIRHEAALAQARREAREEALREAAQTCIDVEHGAFGHLEAECAEYLCAKAIRSLIATKPEGEA